jgi:hypothetical protein
MVASNIDQYKSLVLLTILDTEGREGIVARLQGHEAAVENDLLCVDSSALSNELSMQK